MKPNIRQIRVFVSSTFKDMRDERDYLVKNIFPQLRRLCESRNVVWGDVDLRWGVTNEQKAEGQVLPICLEEIERCRPFFIGLLGERYGWIPDKIPSYLLEREPWLGHHAQSSVTEIEIVHGVLRDPAMQGHGFFYFRDPTYLNRLPAGTNRVDYQTENEIARQKLQTLKAKLRQARADEICRLRENYHDPQELGKWVLEDFTNLINTLYPEAQKPSWLEREASEHDVFALSRTGIYIGRQEYFDRLDTHVASEEPPLVVLGESGSGKSALLSNWAIQHRHDHPEDLVVLHFLGASPQSSSWTSIIQRIMGEIKSRLNFAEEIPDKAEELRSNFFKWLTKAGAQMVPAPQTGISSGLPKWFSRRAAPSRKLPGRIILILDGLNQLEDRDSAPDLVWLPPVMPANVSLIVSSLPGRALEEIKNRKWPELNLSPLSLEERRRLIAQVLASHAKSLSSERVDKLAGASSCANPLYLRLVLEELCIFGEYERLDERINFYLEASSPRELYKKVISRWKQDYGGQSSIVEDTLSLLWAARRGLSETEILEILGTKDCPMARAEWSPLYLAMSGALVSQAGLLNFAHDYLRSAVFEICLPDANLQQSAHLRLAGYFQQLPLGIRRSEELPWQLCQAKQWQQLADYLGQPVSLLVLTEETHFDIYTFWAEIEANSSIRMVDVYRKFIENPNLLDANEILRFHILLRNTGHLEEALLVFEKMPPILDLNPNNQAQHAWDLHMAGKSKEALALLDKLETTCRLIDDPKNLAICFGTQATILSYFGEIDRAVQLHTKEEKLYRELGFQEGISTSLANQALLLSSRDNEKGMVLIQEAERIERQRGDLYGLQSCLWIKASLQFLRGDLDDALRLLSEQEQICRQTGQEDGLATSLSRRAEIFLKQNRLDEAEQLCNQTEKFWRASKQPTGLQIVLSLKANILEEQGDLAGALALFQEQERICRSINFPGGLEQSLGGQAGILQKQGKGDEALLLLKQAEGIARRIGSIDLQTWLGQEGKLKVKEGKLDEAMSLFLQQEQIARETNQIGSLEYSMGFQGVVLFNRGQLEQALQQFELAVGYGRQAKDLVYLKEWLLNAGLVLRQQKQYARALEKFLEQEKYCLETNSQTGLCSALLEQGNTYLVMGKSAEALGALKRAESLSRQVNSRPGLPDILAAKGLILKQSGQLEMAEVVLQEHSQLCRQANDANGLQFSLGVRSAIALSRGQLQAALALAGEQESICRANQLQKGISAALSTQGDIRACSGNRSEAKRLYAKSIQISRAINDLDSLQNQLCAQGWAHFMSGEIDDAMHHFEEQEQISRQVGNQDGLEASLGGQGSVKRYRGQSAEALLLFEEQEKICRLIGNVRNLQASLNNQGLVQWETGNFKQAMTLFESVEQTCRKLGDVEVLWHTLYNQAEILFRHLGNPGSARKKVSEAVAILRKTGLEPDWLKKCMDLQHEIGI